MNKRLFVGLVIDEMVDDYALAICQGAALAADELDVDLVTIPVGAIKPEANAPDDWKNTFYNTMYNYPTADMLDVLVVSVGSIFSGHPYEFVRSHLEPFRDIPLVTIALGFNGCGCVRFDNRLGIKGVIEHLINEHGCRSIGYVSGLAGNIDSDDRLATYRGTLAAHGIPVREELIAHGDFSENSRPAIQALLDAHLSEMDAICCGNDCMAQITCQELEHRGVHPGKDIAVTGYDNMPWSFTMSPTLTTVGADAAELGYQSVFEAVRLSEGKPCRTVETPTAPIIRESCGCSAVNSSALYDSMQLSDMTEAVQAIMAGREYTPTHDSATGILARSWIMRLEPVIRRMASEAADPSTAAFSLSELIAMFRTALSSAIMDSNSVDTLHDLLFVLRDVLLSIVSNEDKKLLVYDAILLLQRVLSNVFSTLHYSLTRQTHRDAVVMDGVSMPDEFSAERTLLSILEQLDRMGINSSWIYLLDEPLPVGANMPPETLHDMSLRGYQIGSKCRTICTAEGRMPNSMLVRNSFIPEDPRKNMLMLPLFSAREQYGLLLCDLPCEYFSYLNSLSRQISAVLETSHLLAQLNEQMDQMSLRYAALRNIASRDELTGCYNRRGFFEVSEHIARMDANEGCRAVVVFADLDNLKTINDTYGHDEGDKALILASQALQKCFSPTSIIGRIGGDEFAVFDIIGSESLDFFHRRLKDTMGELDRTSAYPYHVMISAGLAELRCNSEVVVRGYVDRADRQQYVDKKKKSDNVKKS